MDRNEVWEIIDSRNNKRATVACFLSKANALQQIAEWNERNERGERQDVAENLPYLVPRKVKF